MRWRAVVWAVYLGMFSILSMAKGAVEPPPSPEFTAPLVEAPREPADPPIPMSPPPAPIEAKPSPLKGSNARPVLIVPGMSSARGANKPRTGVSAPVPSVILSTPESIEPPGRGSVDSSELPMTLESIPTGEAKSTDRPKPSRDPSSKPANPHPNPAVRPNPNPRRPASILARWFPQLSRGLRDVDGDGIHVDAKTDPATDAAMKRRVEKQIRESVGPRLKAFDVRVVGRDIVIRAQSTRFWQKRATRTAIEALPALSGYNALVEIVD